MFIKKKDTYPPPSPAPRKCRHRSALQLCRTYSLYRKKKKEEIVII